MSHTSLASNWLSVRRRPQLLRRVHSLTGAVALGSFLLLHLMAQGRALWGWSSYNEAAQWSASSPVLLWVELLIVQLPLLYHAGYGLTVVLQRQRQRGLGRHPFRKKWAWALQRISGSVALVFIIYHLWHFRWQVWLGHMSEQDFFPRLCADLSSTNSWGFPLVAFAYTVGTAACIVHWCNGLSGFCFYWGLTRSRRAVRTTSWLLGALGLLLFAYAVAFIIYFATGSTPADIVG